MVKIYDMCNDLVDFADMALPPRDKRHRYLSFEGLQYTNADITDFETRLGKIYRREFQLGEVRRRMSWRQLILALGLHTVEDMETTRLIACSIAGRNQAPEKETVTGLFYLRGMDVGSVNVPYLLARELVRLQICEELDDTWAWVAPGPERHHDVVAGALEIAEGAPDVVEGDQAVPAPVHAPPPPPPAAGRIMSQRLGRLEEEIQGLRQDVGSLRRHVERSMTD
ncbi:hypothetical protein Tco_1328086 [Tanacetum coccineum]